MSLAPKPKLKALLLPAGQVCPRRLGSWFESSGEAIVKERLAEYRAMPIVAWRKPEKFDENRWVIVEDTEPESNEWGEISP